MQEVCCAANLNKNDLEQTFWQQSKTLIFEHQSTRASIISNIIEEGVFGL